MTSLPFIVIILPPVNAITPFGLDLLTVTEIFVSIGFNSGRIISPNAFTVESKEIELNGKR